MSELRIGDIIEVKILEQNDPLGREVWRRGNVCHIDDIQIGVEFKDGERRMVPRYGYTQMWR